VSPAARRTSGAERWAIEGWSVRAIAGESGSWQGVPRSVRERSFAVPDGGGVHAALGQAGLLPDSDEPGGEDAQEFIGRTDWAFTAWFRWAPPRREPDLARVDLVIDWIDVPAEIRLNGVRVGTAGNEFVEFRVPVGAFLAAGHNEIEVRCRGPVLAVHAIERRLGPRPVNGDWTPFPFLRKSACSFGWDWGPRTPTVSIGPARLERWGPARIVAVRPAVVACSEAEALLDVHVDVERLGPVPLRCEVTLAAPTGDPRRWACGVDVDEGQGGAVVRIPIADPARWWPRGHGDQALHELEVRLLADGQSTAVERCSIGLRSVALRQEADADGSGSGFAIEVNGIPIWCRGANWIPVSLAPRAADPARTDDLLRDALAANMTMLRVWGGGIYESERFYSRCDEAGLLVWQDFAFACGTYPEESPYPELIEAEARAQVARLMRHPSLVLWCGGNEDFLAWWSWGWRERLRPGQSWGRGYWFERLPAIVSELDPTRPYWPESPYSGDPSIHPNLSERGDRHTWDVRCEGYRSIVPRFASEFGQQSPPSIASVRELLPGDGFVLGAAELALRQRAWGGDAAQYAAELAERFPPIATLDDWIIAAQLVQARAYAIAFEWLRANAPRCMGALVWQLNDVWRGHSWSLLDVRGRRKPSWFAVRRACAPLALTVLPEQGRAALLIAHGEAGTERPPSSVTARLIGLDGRCLLGRELALSADSDWTMSAAIPPALFNPERPSECVLVLDAGSLRATHWFLPDRLIHHRPPRFEVRLTAEGAVVSADTVVRDLCLLAELAADGLRAGDGMLTLLPGEKATIAIEGVPMPDAARLRDSLRFANAIGR
jgi:beta-mannosidase